MTCAPPSMTSSAEPFGNESIEAFTRSKFRYGSLLPHITSIGIEIRVRSISFSDFATHISFLPQLGMYSPS